MKHKVVSRTSNDASHQTDYSVHSNPVSYALLLYSNMDCMAGFMRLLDSELRERWHKSRTSLVGAGPHFHEPCPAKNDTLLEGEGHGDKSPPGKPISELTHVAGGE